MEFFPYFRGPYGYNRMNYYNGYGMRTNMNSKPRQNIDTEDKMAELSNKRQEANQKQSQSVNKKDTYKNVQEPSEKRASNSQDEPVFEIFGIKLCFDDILIVALIFFLYNEGVKDNLLFISLILILLS